MTELQILIATGIIECVLLAIHLVRESWLDDGHLTRPRRMRG